MANDSNKDKEISQRQDRLVNEKACFQTSDRKIFMNLHKAATQKASNKLHKTYSVETIHDIFINTGMSEDGRSLANDDVIKDNNRILKLFSSQSNQYEVGLVLEYTDFKAPTDEDVKKYKTIQNAIYELNKDGIDKIRQTAFETLREYFKFFSDTPENNISKEKMVEFIPDYNGEKIAVEDYKIKSMDEKKVQDYLMNRKNSKTEDSKNFKPRFGFKYGYTLVFGTSSEGNKSTENVKDAQKEQK